MAFRLWALEDKQPYPYMGPPIHVVEPDLHIGWTTIEGDWTVMGGLLGAIAKYGEQPDHSLEIRVTEKGLAALAEEAALRGDGLGGERKKKRKRKGTRKLTNRQLEALEIYDREGTYQAVGDALGITRQGASELVKKAQAARQAILDEVNRAGRAGGTSVRPAGKLPEDRRRQVNIADNR